jgi:hypothetical protein
VAEQYTVSERHACRLIGIARSTKRYRNCRKSARWVYGKRLRSLALERPRFGYRRLCALLAREGQKANHKCVYGCIGRKVSRCGEDDANGWREEPVLRKGCHNEASNGGRWIS